NVPVTDLRQLRGAEQEVELRRLLEQAARRPFDMQSDLMFRPSLIRLADEEYVFQLMTHHVGWDAWSKAVVYREMGQLYRGFRASRPVQLPELPIQYADFALWQQRSLQGPSYEKLVAYWKGQLGGAQPKLELPTDHPRPPVQTFRGNKYLFTLPAELAEAAKTVSKQEGVTLFMTLLAA